MTDHASVRGSAVDVIVHIQQVEEDKLTKLVWYYNGVAGDNLDIMANISTSEINFQMDSYTKSKFRFLDVKLVRKRDDHGDEYEDLEVKSITDDCVIISDTQENHRVTVGGLTFTVATLEGVVAPYGNGYDEDSFESPDPEVTNTGEFEEPPPAS